MESQNSDVKSVKKLSGISHHSSLVTSRPGQEFPSLIHQDRQVKSSQVKLYMICD